jgi:nucleoside-diphosphate-sugar epimerase
MSGDSYLRICATFPASLQADGVPPLIVFGGNGYVGSHCCQEALRCGLPVTSVNRSGRPTNDDREWVSQVDWVAADALYSESYKDLFQNCIGVVSCIGLISTSQAEMKKINGDANIAIINAAADAGVERLAYISAHDYHFPGDLLVMKGYFEGKREAEAELFKRFPRGGAFELTGRRKTSAYFS